MKDEATLSSALICHARHGVSTESGSDRVSGNDKIEFAKSLTRSLPLPVLTSSVQLGNYPTLSGASSILLAITI